MAGLDLKAHRLDRFFTSLRPFPKISGNAVLDESNVAIAANLVPVTPESLDDLKAWLGVPNDAVDHQQHGLPMRAVDVSALPTQSFSFDELSTEQQNAVESSAYNLLFGFADSSQTSQAPHAAVVEHLLAVNHRLLVLVGDDLTVQDGQTYTITTPTCVFGSITIYGTGTLGLANDSKIITDSLTYLP